MPYCEACGAQIGANAKFCGNCGAPRTPTQSTPEPAKTPKPAAQVKQRLNYYSPPNMAYIPSAPYPIVGSHVQSQPPQQYQPQPQIAQPQPLMTPTPIQPVYAPIQQPLPIQNGDETTIGVLLFRHNKSLGRYDSYAGVITTKRMIFAQLTADMLNQAAQQARDQAKAEGKGFLGAWGDQLRATFGYINRYLNIPPDMILAETPGNAAIYNNTINAVNVHLKGQHENDGPREFEVEIKTTAANYKYRMNENSDYTNILKRAYGNRVSMPFGYIGVVNIKF
jgi:hypothetical protein